MVFCIFAFIKNQATFDVSQDDFNLHGPNQINTQNQKIFACDMDANSSSQPTNEQVIQGTLRFISYIKTS